MGHRRYLSPGPPTPSPANAEFLNGKSGPKAFGDYLSSTEIVKRTSYGEFAIWYHKE